MSPKKKYLVNTAEVKSIPTVAKTKGVVRKLWLRCAKAEERSRLIQFLLEKGVGTNDVERFCEDQCKKRFGRKKGVVMRS